MKFKALLAILCMIVWSTINAAPLSEQVKEIAEIIRSSSTFGMIQERFESKTRTRSFKDAVARIIEFLATDNLEGALKGKFVIQTACKTIQSMLSKAEVGSQDQSVELYQEGQVILLKSLKSKDVMSVIGYLNKMAKSKSFIHIYLLVQVEFLYQMIHSGHFTEEEVESLKENYIKIKDISISKFGGDDYEDSWLISEEKGLLKKLGIF